MTGFDLIEYQREARNRKQPGELFQLWEEVCRHYDRGLIGQYELDEMKAVIWPNMRVLTVLKNTIDDSFVREKSAA